MSQVQLFKAIQQSDIKRAKELYLKHLDKASRLVNQQKSSLLHVTATQNNYEILCFFLQEYNKAIASQPQLYTQANKIAWINKKDNEGFTCLHFAIFRGNIRLALKLQDMGADIHMTNREGLTSLHIAAQGNSPALIHYYLNKGFDIDCEDSRGCTALHWACYSGQEYAAFSLISWGANINKQQKRNGMTPLHLATLCGNSKIVKKLLIRGCHRSIKNSQGQSALEIAKSQQYGIISDMIEDSKSLQELCNLKIPYRKVSTYSFSFYLVIFLFGSHYLFALISIIFRDSSSQILDQQISSTQQQQNLFEFIYLYLGLAATIFYMMAACSKPGYIQPDSNLNAHLMLKKNHPSKLCFDCMLICPERSKHCQYCNHCISVYDHHCPWIANCVGSHNYCVFYSFLVFIESFLIFTVFYQISNFSILQWQQMSNLMIFNLVCGLYRLVSAFLFIFPVSLLLMVQTKNCILNQTTFQRFTKKKDFSISHQQPFLQGNLSDHLSEQLLGRNQIQKSTDKNLRRSSIILNENFLNPFRNCYKMCCGNKNNVTYLNGRLR